MLDDAFSFDIKNAKLSLQTASSPANWITATSNQNLQSNTWYHLVGIKDYSNRLFKLYVNGELIFQQTCNDTTSRSGANLIFGNYKNNALNPSVVFSGKLDDIAIYNRALTQSEITTLYNSNSCISNITNNDTSICRGSSITLNAAAVSPASVTDINGNVYPTVNIGTQTWMQKNLNVSKYKNGDVIPQVSNATQWAALTTGAWCWYNNDSATYAATYGKLYNWYAVNDPRGLAPDGWHVPSDGEWNKLVKYLDASADTVCILCDQNTFAGNSMKEVGTVHWNVPNNGSTNSSGFSSLPGGVRYQAGNYEFRGYSSNYWATNSNGVSNAYYRNNVVGYAGVYRANDGNKLFGLSVRALRNTPTYLWSTGATTPSISVSPTVTTKYYCTVSDGVNTCKDSVTVTVSTITTNFITADTIKVCGTSTTISATTGLASYAWSNGTNTASTNVTSSGWYTCTATNGACNAVDSVYVSLFNPKITQNDTTVCAGTPLTLNANTNTSNSLSTLSQWQIISSQNDFYTRVLKTNAGFYLCGAQTNNRLYKSNDLSNFTPLASPLVSHTLSFGKDKNGVLYFGTGHEGIYRSTDNGNTWNYNVASGYGCGNLDFDFDSSNNLYTGVGGYLRGLYVSNNNGTNWQNTNSGMDFTEIHCVPLINKTFIVTCAYLAVSSNNGQTWSQITGQPFSSNTIMIKHIGNIVFLFTNTGKIYTSTDNANTWSLYSTFPVVTTPSYYLNDAILNSNGDWWIAIDQNGVFHSTNGGLSWTNENIGISGNTHYLLKDSNSILITTSTGIYKKTILSPITYLWSTTATTQSITVNPTATTSYIATVSNGINTCKDTVKITVATITTNLITADTIKVCGTSTTISATTGLASYAWSNGANTASSTVTSSGWYKCTATNGACTAVDSVYVSLFNPKITQNDTTVCAGTPLTLTVNNNTALTSSLPANLRNGLVGYWPFNGNTNDESGNGNNGTVNGATLTSDRSGSGNKAYYFNGFSYISVANNSTLNFGTGDYTISAWGNRQGTNQYQNIISKQLLGPNYTGWSLNFINNYPRFEAGATNNGSWIGNGEINNVAPYSNPIYNDTWNHFVAVFNPSNLVLKLYINGILAITKSTSSSLINPDNINNLFFGVYQPSGAPSGAEFLTGMIDDIAIYNRAISANEVQQLYSGSSYLWSTTATTQSISVNPTATTSFIVTVSNGINTCKDTVKITVTNITSLAPTAIFGAVDVCASIGADTASVPVNYKINKIANAASYVWTVPAGVTLLSGQGDTSIMVRFSASFVSGAITVKSVSTCNVSSAIKSVTVYKRVAAAPTAIQKEFTPTSIVATTNVSGLVSEVYRIKKVLYATSYNWYLNRGTNASITHVNPSGENDTAVIVTFASCFVKDTLSVKSVTPCSISTAKTVIMSSSTTPATVAGITNVGGDFAVCIGTSKTFTAIAGTPSTTQVGIARYRWTNPVNTIITSATSDSSSITVSFNTGFTGGSLTCKGISGCGVVGTTATTAILQYLPPTPLSIGSSTNSYNACINSSVTYTALVGTATTAQAQASVFRWTKPNNTTITSATADSSSITLRFNTGYTGGVISVKGQSRCGAQSAARSQTLTHTGCALGTKMSLPITTTNTASFEVSLYPNPTTSEFKLLIKNNAVVGTNKPSKAIVKVIDVQGRMMKSFTTNTNQVTAIGNELKSGVYMVEVRVGDEVKVIRAVKF